MSGKTDYTKLSRIELQDLINKDDFEALKEHARRVKAGEIKLKTVTMEEIKEIYRKPKAS